MFGIGNLFDPSKLAGTSLFGGPKPPSGAAGWGQITPPGAPQGMLDSPPGGLLRAGDDDMRPPPMEGGTGGMPLLKAGLEGGPLGGARGGITPPPGAGGDRDMASVPASGAQMAQYIIPSSGQAVPKGTTTPMPGGGPEPLPTPGQNRANSLYPDTPVTGPDLSGGRRVPESTSPVTGITSPSLSPQYTPTPPTALETGGAPGNVRSPYDVAPPAAAPAPAPANAPGGGAAAGTGAAGSSSSSLDKLGDIGKAISGGGAGGQKPPIAGHQPGGVGAAFTPNGAALMAEQLKLHPAVAAGPVPGLPPGLLERYKR